AEDGIRDDLVTGVQTCALPILLALVEPGSCFAGTLAELVLAADRSLMLDGTFDDGELPAPTMMLSAANDGWYPMVNGLSRLATRSEERRGGKEWWSWVSRVEQV